jgi:ABC-type antimicrobial peptide transport system permease subunit
VALKKMLAAVVVMHATHDYELLAALTAVWIAIGVLASVAPARRAASIDPVKALRIE